MTQAAIARRNDIHRPGADVFVLRHHKLIKGYYQAYAQASRRVRLLYEKIGVRVVGEFRTIHPEGSEPADYDETYRLAHYASYEHWVDTRRPADMIGDGPLTNRGRSVAKQRQEYLLDSDGAYFMTGAMIDSRPYHLPATDEEFEPDTEAGDGLGPVRYGIPIPGDEIATLHYWQITKGSFESFQTLTTHGMLPVMDKMGVRALGLWQLIYPDPAIGQESKEYDEVLMLTRFASYQHWQATANPARIIGDGPDYEAWREANDERNQLTLDGWLRFLRGDLYRSPPTYTPPLSESFIRR